MICIFEIIVGSDFFYGTMSECFTCTFYCQTERGAFPDGEWIDFALTVLSWWSNAVGEAIYVKETKFKLLFEDGPFWIDAVKRDDAVTLHFNTDRRGIPVIPDAQIPFRDLAEAVERAMRSLSSALYLAGKAEDARMAAEQAAYLRRRIS